MNAYAAQDTQEERRLEHAAWQDAVSRDFEGFTQHGNAGVARGTRRKRSQGGNRNHTQKTEHAVWK